MFILPSTVYDSPVKRSLLPLTAGGLEPVDVRLGDGVPLLDKQEQKEKQIFYVAHVSQTKITNQEMNLSKDF